MDKIYHIKFTIFQKILAIPFYQMHCILTILQFYSRFYHPKKLMINLDSLNPDWAFATSHGQANRAGISDLKGQNVVVCRCCHEQVQKEPVSLMQNSKQLEFLGFGYPLFYEFLKSCMVLLILAILSYNAMEIQQSLYENYDFCHPKEQHHRRLLASSSSNDQSDDSSHALHCTSWLVQMASIQPQVTLLQQSLRIVSFVLQLLALLYIRNRIIKLQKYYDERTTSLSDYSIIFKGLTKMKGIQGKLKSFLQKEFKTPHEIKQITLLPQYQEMEKFKEQKHRVIDQLRSYYDKNTQNTDETALELQQKLKQVEKAITEDAMHSKQLAGRDQLECEKIICVFNSEPEKQQILEEFEEISDERKAQYFGENFKHVYVKEAPQPEQIIWKNVNLTKSKKLFFLLLGWGLSILLLVVLFVIFFKILEAKALLLAHALEELEKHEDEAHYITQYQGAVALVYILIFFVVLFDKIVLSTLYYKFTQLQRHSDNSKFQFSFALKLSLGLFFTTAIMTLAVQATRFHNYASHPYGVIEEETIMFFMNSFFVPFFWVVNPMRIYKQVKRYLKYGKRSLTQKQANQLMEQEKYQMGKRFAEVLETMWFTFLYSTLIPIGAVITCAGLFVYYWTDKYNLLRRSSVNGTISGKLIQTSLTLLDLTLILRPIGSIVFDAQLRHVYLTSTIVQICVAAAYILIPKDWLIQFFNEEKFRPEQKTYDQVKEHFWKTYHSLHPVYRVIHSQKFLKKLLSRGISLDMNKTNTSINDSDILLNGGSLHKLKDASSMELIASPEKISRENQSK